MNKKVVKGLSIFCLSMGLGLALGGGSEKYSLYELDQLYAYCQGNEGDWPRVLENTKEAVLAMLTDKKHGLSNEDMMSISAFCYNYHCILQFVQSKFYNNTKHDECLKNLFRLSSKAVGMVDKNKEETVKMKQYKALIEHKNSKNLLTTIATSQFSDLAKLASRIISRNIDWGD